LVYSFAFYLAELNVMALLTASCRLITLCSKSRVRISLELILFMKASRIISSRYYSVVTFLYSQILLSRWSACRNSSSDSLSRCFLEMNSYL
ncbi:hypothetical protein T03_483, partial [Trichinella britovi]